jgi:hypothetical protein
MQMTGTWGRRGQPTTIIATGLSREGANHYMFEYDDRASGEKREISVADYFNQVLGQRLQFPALQCVTVCSTRVLITVIQSAPGVRACLR